MSTSRKWASLDELLLAIAHVLVLEDQADTNRQSNCATAIRETCITFLSAPFAEASKSVRESLSFR
jgi:hypothetical protein